MVGVALHPAWRPSDVAQHRGRARPRGGNESYPDLFQPYGGFPDGVRVADSHIIMPELPGIGFEGKGDLIEVMRALAGVRSGSKARALPWTHQRPGAFRNPSLSGSFDSLAPDIRRERKSKPPESDGSKAPPWWGPGAKPRPAFLKLWPNAPRPPAPAARIFPWVSRAAPPAARPAPSSPPPMPCSTPAWP